MNTCTLPTLITNLFLGESEVAYVDEKLLSFQTIRHVKCHVLISPSTPSPKCPICISYNSTLRKLLSRQNNSNAIARTDPNSKMNDRWRTTSELKDKMTKLKIQKRAATERMQRLEMKLSEMIKRDGMEVSHRIALFTLIA